MAVMPAATGCPSIAWSDRPVGIDEYESACATWCGRVGPRELIKVNRPRRTGRGEPAACASGAGALVPVRAPWAVGCRSSALLQGVAEFA